ncbi:MAG: hypothetical protein AMK71_10610 [Nitrospira bacterium SG8_35_4]|nr:MAG: hypothetical protein AMK71_10610 [Nitrospira bacterium SG8_35_4]
MKHAIADIPLPPMPEKNIFRGLSCIIHDIVTHIIFILVIHAGIEQQTDMMVHCLLPNMKMI